MNVYEQTIIIRGKRKCVNPLAAAAETPHTLRAKSIHQVLPMLSECASKTVFTSVL